MNDQIMLSQPPPDAPAPPPGPQALRSKRVMSAILWLGGGCILLLLLSSPFLFRSRRSGPRSEAISNAKQIGLALQEFECDYGRFPDDSTAAKVKADTGTALTLGGRSSNSLFRQLFATGLKSEKPFYGSSASGKRPDELFADDAHALASGECRFAYVAGLSGSGDPEIPVVMTPMIAGTTRFDRSIYDGKAVILTTGNFVRLLTIDSSGRAIYYNGMDLFDPRQPFWHGKAPDLRWPE